MRLSELKRHEEGVIKSITEAQMLCNAKFNPGDVESKLLDMGFIEGANIKIMHKGVWGGEPIIVRINNNNTMISLRKNEASAIAIENIRKHEK
ncbi:MAG: ferrous iron transport protein A [Neisseriaceae bacterium]